MAKELMKTEAPKMDNRASHEEIARRAYEIFIERGRPEGRDQEHWFAAESQLAPTLRPPPQAKPASTGKTSFFSARR
jgi:hypothetical protein